MLHETRKGKGTKRKLSTPCVAFNHGRFSPDENKTNPEWCFGTHFSGFDEG